MYISLKIFFKKSINFTCKHILGVQEIQTNGLAKERPVQGSPNMGQVISGSRQSGANLYIQGHTLQEFISVVKCFHSQQRLLQSEQQCQEKKRKKRNYKNKSSLSRKPEKAA
jgi:hypothetical protein